MKTLILILTIAALAIYAAHLDNDTHKYQVIGYTVYGDEVIHYNNDPIEISYVIAKGYNHKGVPVDTLYSIDVYKRAYTLTQRDIMHH